MKVSRYEGVISSQSDNASDNAHLCILLPVHLMFTYHMKRKKITTIKC